MTEHSITGGCACGAIRFRYRGQLGGALGNITLCQCSLCRRLHGLGAAVVPAEAAGFTLLSGARSLRAWESSPGKERCFCAACGTPIFSRKPALPDRLRLRIGCIDTLPEALRIEALIYAEGRPGWCSLQPPPTVYAKDEPRGT